MRPAALLLALLVGCARSHSVLVVDPDVTFAAHRDGDVFVLDRTRAGIPAVVEPASRLREDYASDLVLRPREGDPIGLWTIGRSRVLVRDGTSNFAPRAGEVVCDWDGGGILRLTLHTRSAGVFPFDPFDGADDSRRPSRLARGARVDALAYRAVLRDARGEPVGWLRVLLPASEDAPRRYDAVLPASVDDAVAAAAVVALDAEISWIAAHGDGR